MESEAGIVVTTRYMSSADTSLAHDRSCYANTVKVSMQSDAFVVAVSRDSVSKVASALAHEGSDSWSKPARRSAHCQFIQVIV